MPTKVSLYYKKPGTHQSDPYKMEPYKSFCRGHMIPAFVDKMVSPMAKWVSRSKTRKKKNSLVVRGIQYLAPLDLSVLCLSQQPKAWLRKLAKDLLSLETVPCFPCLVLNWACSRAKLEVSRALRAPIQQMVINKMVIQNGLTKK